MRDFYTDTRTKVIFYRGFLVVEVGEGPLAGDCFIYTVPRGSGGEAFEAPWLAVRASVQDAYRAVDSFCESDARAAAKTVDTNAGRIQVR